MAYYSAGEAGPEVEQLRAYIKERLPEYMVPAAYVRLERLPLTANGKLDRKGLPAPDISALGVQQYEAPQGEIETALAGLWQELLHVPRVGRRDNFFELGGHSLLAVQLIERLRRLNIAATPRNVFSAGNLAELASVLQVQMVSAPATPPNLIPAGCHAITPAMLTLVQLQQQHIDQIVRTVPGGAPNVQDVYPLAPLQEGIHFHHLLQRGPVIGPSTAHNVGYVASRVGHRVGEALDALRSNDDWSDLYEVATAAGEATLLRERVRDVDENWPDSMLPFEGRLYFHTNEFDEIVEHDMTSGSQRNIVSGGGVRLGSVHGGYVYYCRNLTTYERAPLQVDVPTVLVEGVGVGESIACHVGAHGQYFYYVRGNRVLRQRTPD